MYLCFIIIHILCVNKLLIYIIGNQANAASVVNFSKRTSTSKLREVYTGSTPTIITVKETMVLLVSA